MAAIPTRPIVWTIDVLGDVRVTCSQAAASGEREFTNFGKPSQALLAYLARDLTSKPARDLTSKPARDLTSKPAQDLTSKPAQDLTSEPVALRADIANEFWESTRSKKVCGGEALQSRLPDPAEVKKRDDRLRAALTAINQKLKLNERSSRKESLFIGGTGKLSFNRLYVTSDLMAFAKARVDAETYNDPDADAQAPQARIAHLLEAKRLYRGDFLPTLQGVWVKTHRVRLAEEYLDVLAKLAQATCQAGEQDQAQKHLDEYLEREESFARKYGVTPRSETRWVVESLRNRLSFQKAVSESATKQGTSQGRRSLLNERESTVVIRGKVSSPDQELPSRMSEARFVPRDQDIDNLRTLLPPVDQARSISRLAGRQLVTLWGPPGYGKKRLAAEYVKKVRRSYERANGSILSVSTVAGIDDRGFASLIAKAVASVLGKTWDESPPLAFLKSQLSHYPVLLVLVVEETERLTQTSRGELVTLLSQMPNICCLLIAEQPLDLSGEQAYKVPPLALPSADDTPAALRKNPCVQLLLEWANAVTGPHRGLILDEDEQASSVAELCRQLGGVPLAIQIIASWLSEVPPRDMVQRLASSDVDQQGWPAAWRLMTTLAGPDLMHFLEQMAALPGSWTIDAAKSIFPEASVQDYISMLLRHGLLEHANPRLISILERPADQPLPERGLTRFDLPYAVRYMINKLRLSREPGDGYNDPRAAHAAYFSGVAIRLRRQAQGAKQDIALDALEQENIHLEAALGWCLKDKHDVGMGLCMAGNLWGYWEQRNYWKRGLEWLKLALKEGIKTGNHLVLADVCNGLAVISMNHRQMGEAEGAARRAWTYVRKARNEPEGIKMAAQVMTSRASIERRKADDGKKDFPAESARQAARARRRYSRALNMLKMLADTNGTPLGLEALWLNHGLGSVARDFDGNLSAAASFYAAALEVGLLHQDRGGMAHILVSLADVSGRKSDTLPWIYLELCFRYRRELRLWGGLAECIEKFGYWSARRRNPERAFYLYGVARRLREIKDIVPRRDSQPESRQAYQFRNSEDIKGALKDVGIHTVGDELLNRFGEWFDKGYVALPDREALLDEALDVVLDWPPEIPPK